MSLCRIDKKEKNMTISVSGALTKQVAEELFQRGQGKQSLTLKHIDRYDLVPTMEFRYKEVDQSGCSYFRSGVPLPAEYKLQQLFKHPEYTECFEWRDIPRVPYNAVDGCLLVKV
jgi:hypothetical protein